MPNYSGVWNLVQQLQARGQNLWPTPPGPPTSVSATAGNAQATVSFTAPADTGIPAGITGYRVTSSPGAITATGASSPITVTGLTNGTSYTFTVAAQNATGYGPESSPSGSVTPTEPNFLASLAGTSIDLYVGGGFMGSDGVVYTSGRASSTTGILARYTAAGALSFQINYGLSRATALRSCADSSGNIYLVFSASAGNPRIIKVNSSGAVQWAYDITGGGENVSSVFLSGTTLYIGTAGGLNGQAHLISFDVSGSGSLNWSRQYNGQSNSFAEIRDITVYAGNVYFCGIYIPGGAPIVGMLGSCATNGTSNWVRSLDVTGNQRTQLWSVAVNSTGTLHVYYLDSSGSGQTGILTYDTSYNPLSRRYFTQNFGGRLRIDASNNVYMLYSASGLNFIKFNSSFTQQFATRLRSVNGYYFDDERSFTVSSQKMATTSTFVNGATGYSQLMTFKTPNDGSLTGTYTVSGLNFAYENYTAPTFTTVSGVTTGSNVTTTTGTLTASSTTVTGSATSYTSSIATF